MENLNEKLVKLEATRDELLALKAPIDRKLDRNFNAIKKLQKQIDEQKIKDMEAGKIDWKDLLKSAPDFDSLEMHGFFSKAVHGLGMHASGRWSDTFQPSVSIKLTFGDAESLKKNIAGVRLLMKHFEPIDGIVRFDLFDHGLSEWASYSVEVDPKTKEVVLVNSRHRTTRKAIGKLPVAMKYLQEHHWYDGKEEDDD